MPAGSANLRFELSGGSGNADLYVRYGALPTQTTFDYAPRTPDQLRGYVRPVSLAGARVLIQRQQGPGWITAADTTVAADGTFIAKLQLADGVYRARVGSGHGFVAGFSPVLQVANQ